MPARTRATKDPDRERALLIARACEAYAHGRIATFARLSGRLDAIGRAKLAIEVRSIAIGN